MYALMTTHLVFFRYALPIAAVVLVLAWLVLGKRKEAVIKWGLCLCLAVLFLFSALFYTQRNYAAGKYFNAYEFFHYYMGAKYHKELGYRHLYDMTYLAMEEENYPKLPGSVRDLYTDRTINSRSLLKDKAVLRERFSEERWVQWKGDVLDFRKSFKTSKAWDVMMQDRGFNATPVWIMAAGPLTNLFKIDGTPSIYLLPWLDVLLAMLAFACLWRAFGLQVAAFTFIFLFTHYVTSQWPLKAAFLRLDWIVALLCSMSMLKMKRYGWAGFFAAVATCMRIFPVLFVFGLVAKLLMELLLKRKLNQGLFRFFVSATLTGLVLVGLSLLYTGGLGSWLEFFEKIREHGSSIRDWRIGMVYVFIAHNSATNTLWGMTPTQILEHYGWILHCIRGVVLVLCFILSYRLKNYEAMALGIIPVFLLTGSTYYYYIMLGVPFLFFAANQDKRLYVLGMIFMFATAAIGHHYFLLWNRIWPLFFTLSCCIAITSLYMMVLAAIRLYQGEQEVAELSTNPGKLKRVKT